MARTPPVPPPQVATFSLSVADWIFQFSDPPPLLPRASFVFLFLCRIASFKKCSLRMIDSLGFFRQWTLSLFFFFPAFSPNRTSDRNPPFSPTPSAGFRLLFHFCILYSTPTPICRTPFHRHPTYIPPFLWTIADLVFPYMITSPDSAYCAPGRGVSLPPGWDIIPSAFRPFSLSGEFPARGEYFLPSPALLQESLGKFSFLLFHAWPPRFSAFSLFLLNDRVFISKVQMFFPTGSASSCRRQFVPR